MTGRPSTIIPFPSQKHAGNNVKKETRLHAQYLNKETEMLDVFLVDSMVDKPRVSPIPAMLV